LWLFSLWFVLEGNTGKAGRIKKDRMVEKDMLLAACYTNHQRILEVASPGRSGGGGLPGEGCLQDLLVHRSGCDEACLES
jgi:hypothetical protein